MRLNLIPRYRDRSIFAPINFCHNLYTSFKGATKHRTGINKELMELQKNGASYKELEIFRTYYELTKPQHWANLTRTYLELLKNGLFNINPQVTLFAAVQGWFFAPREYYSEVGMQTKLQFLKNFIERTNSR